MGTGTLTNRTDGQIITQAFFNSIHSALNEDFVPRNSSGVATDIAGDLGSTSFRWNDSYIVRMFLGAIASGISFEDDAGDLVLKRNSLEVGRFTVNGLDASDLVDASITLAKMANNSVDTNQLVAAAVTLAKMDANSVGTSQIVNNAVTTDKILNSNVTTAKINDSAVTLNKLANVNYQNSNAINQTLTPSTSETQLTNGSISITISNSNRPLIIILQALLDTGSILLTGSGSIFARIIFKLNTAEFIDFALGGDTRVQFPPSVCTAIIPAVPTGSVTVSVHGITDSATTMQFVDCRLYAFQL